MRLKEILRRSNLLRRVYRSTIIRARTVMAAPAYANVVLRGSTVRFEKHRWPTAYVLLRHAASGRLDYEPEETEIFGGLVANATVFFDIGAQIGYYSLIGAAVNPALKVYAFEMIPVFAREIKRHAATNNLSDQISVFCRPIAEQGRLTRYESYAARRESVSTSLDVFCADEEVWPDLVKMDIEGHEASALRGAEELLRSHQPTLLLSVYPQMLHDLGENVADLISGLRRLGYEIHRITESGEQPLNSVPTELCDLVCRPQI